MLRLSRGSRARRPRSSSISKAASSPSPSGSASAAGAAEGGAHEPARRSPAPSPARRSSPTSPATSRSASNSSRPRPRRWRQTLWEAIQTLAPLAPRFVSVTYGAGGSTRERTHATVARSSSETGIARRRPSHLRRRDARARSTTSPAPIGSAGIRHIVALRGDPPAGMGSKYAPHPGGYANAAELVAGLKKVGAFEISVAAYPEGHPDSPTSRPTSTISSARSMPAPTARSPSSSSSPTTSSASATLRRRPASTCRSCRASCRSRTSPQTASSPACAARAMPAWLDRLFEGLDDDPARAPADRRHRRRRAVPPALCGRRRASSISTR